MLQQFWNKDIFQASRKSTPLDFELKSLLVLKDYHLVF